jgi:hypothetical protein
MIYHGKPVEPHTASHAVSYLHRAQAFETAKHMGPQDALAHIAATIDKPCRAVGVARQALIETGSIPSAIALLEAA